MRTSLYILPIVYFVTVFFPLSSFSYTYNGFEVKDLEGSSTFDLDAELMSWTISSVSATKSSMCDSTAWAGGIGILNNNGAYSQRIYSSLPTHNIIYFTFRLIIHDQWSGTDYITLDFGTGNSIITFNNFITDYNSIPAAACGTMHRGGELLLAGKALHTGSTLTFKVISNLVGAPSTKSFGFRDIDLLFTNKTASDSPTICATSALSLIGKACTCPSGYYRDGSGVCQQCVVACLECFGPTEFTCYGCAYGYFFTGSKCVPCDWTCTVCHGPTPDECDVCSGFATLIGYSCLTTCDPPLAEDLFAWPSCSYPCAPTQYLFPDGSCGDVCQSPLIPTLKYSIKQFCETPCATGFVYWDNSCSGTCQSPFIPDVQNSLQVCRLPQCNGRTCTGCYTNSDCPRYHYCALTSAGKGTCLSYITYSLHCELAKPVVNGYMLTVEVIPNQDISSGAHDQLLASIKTLLPDLNYTATIDKISIGVFQVTIQIKHSISLDPLQAHFKYSPTGYNLDCDVNIPKITFLSDELISATETLKSASVISFVLLSVNTIGFILTGGIATLWSFLPENQYCYYLLYLNVNYLHHTKEYFRSLANYDLLFDLPSNGEEESVIEKYNDLSLPKRFIEEDYPPSFLENAGQILLTLAVITSVIAVLTFLFKMLSLPRRSYLAHRILKIMIRVLKWNGPLRILLAYSLPAALAAFIQNHIAIFSQDIPMFPSVLAVLTVLIVGFGMKVMLNIINDIPDTRFGRVVYSERYGTLWEDLELDNRNTRRYYWLTSLRGIVLSYVAIFFDEFPYAQIGILILYQCWIVSLFFKGFRVQSVFETKSLNIVTLGEDILILCMKIIILVSLVMSNSTQDDSLMISMGWAIIVPGIIIQFNQSLYATGMQLVTLKQLFSKAKAFVRKLFSKSKKTRKIRRINALQSHRRVAPIKASQDLSFEQDSSIHL